MWQYRIGIPEIIYYEVSRELIAKDKINHMQAVTRLRTANLYVALTTEAMDIAARLWADARKRGHPTAPVENIDVDVILAAQADTLRRLGHRVVIATSNSSDLRQFGDCRHWIDDNWNDVR